MHTDEYGMIIQGFPKILGKENTVLKKMRGVHSFTVLLNLPTFIPLPDTPLPVYMYLCRFFNCQRLIF
jgi:hypothetical protein